MTKEHKKLYKAGKNWIVATLTATTITLLGGIGAYTVHADTTIESSQDVQTTSVNQTNQVDNSNNSVTINQPVAVQSSQTAQNDQSVQGNQTNQTVPSSASAAADTSNSDSLDSNIYGTVNVTDWDYQNDSDSLDSNIYGTVNVTDWDYQNDSDSLDSNIYGTVNVTDWDYQNDSNTFNLTRYHGQDTRHIIVPNLNDFDNAGVEIGNATGVGISSKLAKSLASQSIAFAISKTSGKYSDKVTATDNDWSSVFAEPGVTGLIFNDAGLINHNAGLINVDVSNLDTRNITDMHSLFKGYVFGGSTELKTVGDLSNWDTSNVRDMSDMFEYYKGAIGDLSNWDTSNVRNMSWMFHSSLVSVSGLDTWNIRQTTDMSGMFLGSSLPYKIVAANEKSIVPNQVTLKDNTGKVLAIIDTPTIYSTFNSVRSTIDGIVQAEIDKLNKLNHTSYETSKIISDGDDDYSIANATYVVSQSKTGLINYVDQDGKVVKTDQVSGKVGDKVDVKLSLPDGYELANKDEHIPSTITVGEDGIKTITIQVKKLPVVQTGSINYVDQDGKVIKTDTISGKVGDQINVNLSLPDGYKLANKDEQIPSSITVGEDGIKTITIQVKKLPVVQTGSINYVDQDGKVIKTDTISGKVGDQINVNLSLPDGYKLANKDEQIPSSITVGEDGIKTITIQVKKLPVVQTGSINYVDQDGKVIKTDTISGKVGDQINVNLSLPDGYKLANKDEQIPSVITVTENGIGTINVNVKKINTTNTGWNQQGDDWFYMQKNGYLAKGWNYLNGHWFYFDLQSGIMKTGIQSIGNSFYYLNAQHDGTYGAMKTGWQFVNGHWIGLQGSGNAYVGWQAINGHWYYFDPQTAYALTNWQDINNHWYYFDPTNAWAQTGWFKSGAGYWYFFDYANAWADTGWQKINNSWYYFDNVNANALTGWQSINNHWYYFDPTNAWALTGWFKSGAGYWYFFDYANAWADTGWQKINNSWYYFDNVNANALTGWQSINNHWYYFDPTNAWALTGWQWINGHWYWFDQANAWARTGWQYYGGQWYFMDQQNAWMDTGWTTNLANGQLYYLDKNGHPLTGWQRSLNGFWYYLQPGSDAAAIGWNWINGHWYYFNPEETINGIKAKGAMFTGRHFIDNRWNRFDLNGHWLGYEN
jgi:surface protein